MVAEVGDREVLAQRDLVAERGGEQVGVGVAADVAQDRLVIDLAPLVGVEAQRIGEPHREHAGSEREVPRLAGGQVGRIGEDHHEVGTANRDVFLEQLHHSGFAKRGGQIICTYFDESALSLVPAEQAEGLYSCLDYYQDVGDPYSRELLARYNRLFPGSALFTAGSGSSGHYRAIRLWEAAVKEAGSLDQSAVIRALDHARIAQGPGGPAEMVPGQRHVRMNMYIARARNGRFEIVRNLGVVDPNERAQSDEPHLVRAI